MTEPAGIPIHLRRPLPLAWIGYAFATAVGFTWGTLLSTGRVRRHGKLWVFRGLPRWAFRRGGVCVGACYLTADTVSDRVLRHEEIHRQQWRVLGLLLPLWYAAEGSDATRNRFEVEAGLRDGGYR